VRLLDIGCGTGELLADLAAHGYTSLSGIDISAFALAHATERLASVNPTPMLRCCTPGEALMSAGGRRFDIVINADVLEHVPPREAQAFLRTASRLVADGGYLVVITPSTLTGPHDISSAFATPGARPTGLHMHEYSLKELETLLHCAGFGVPETLAVRDGVSHHGDDLSHEAFVNKRRLEPVLSRLPWHERKTIVDNMYFRGLVCRIRS
jgi:2-polyprenyl-3-methyl-5-hydroxy-6-metoxy-1,4-benzoquinol methylase